MARRFVALAFVVTACKEDANAVVSCRIVDGPVECTVTETQSKRRIEVCWEYRVRCDSGAKLDTDRTCASVMDGETVTVTIPIKKLKASGGSECTGTRSTSVSNLTIEGD